MIQAFPPDRADQPLHERVLPGRARRDHHFLDSRALDPVHELVAVGTVEKTIEAMSLAWLVRNVRQLLDGGFRWRTMYFDTAVSLTVSVSPCLAWCSVVLRGSGNG